MFEEGDILYTFKIFRIKSDTFEGDSKICESAALTILSKFDRDRVDPHYTYTLPHVGKLPGAYSRTSPLPRTLTSRVPIGRPITSQLPRGTAPAA